MSKTITIDNYIANAPESAMEILIQIRDIMRKVMPEAEETISYGIPCYKLNNKYVVYFAGYKNHVSIYPLPGNSALLEELINYKSGKGTAQFSLDKKLPVSLIVKMVKLLVKENAERVKPKKK